MHAWHIEDMGPSSVEAARYQEIHRSAAMSAGVYVIPRGAADPQRPHREDEIYHVVRGRGKFTLGHETVDVGAGSILFVPAGVAHRFLDVEEDLTVLVVFAPAESR